MKNLKMKLLATAIVMSMFALPAMAQVIQPITASQRKAGGRRKMG
jgi:hypothetical protein